ncbi:hypothetical protein [Chitiniphilus eburneus]|uniref:Uncharacterized protein n=1 Tax=Chitiniphilus eburneus TaxID=2571148 RepID=A0A4U0PC04_9NEIS|nr:hypothetical protein [Chitiniphilus eburneus]TJZ64472.1 hypothetical protein FAZ21_19090 [Chitiniphilus eburneus]
MKTQSTPSNLPSTLQNYSRTGPNQAGKSTATPAKGLDNLMALAQPSDTAIGQRVGRLGQATLDMAQQFMGSFAEQLFGDQAKGMKVDFDSFELSAQSTASMATYSSQGAQGASQAAAFRLEDSSSFIGRGKLTTADGQVFDFEIEVRYQSIQEAAYASSSGADSQAAIPARDDAAPAARSNDLRTYFTGTSDDLLSQLSGTPVRQPFSMLLPKQDGSGDMLKLLGDLALRLMNLPGGSRYVDLANVGQDAAPASGIVDKA